MDNTDSSDKGKNEESIDWGISEETVDEKGNSKVLWKRSFSINLSSNKGYLLRRNKKIADELKELGDPDLLLRQTANLETITALLLELLKEKLTNDGNILHELNNLDRRILEVEMAVRNIRTPYPQPSGGGMSDRAERDLMQISADVNSIKDILRNRND